MLGDVIVTTPLLRQIRTALPQAKVTLVLGPTNRAVRPLLGNLVDDVLDYEKKPTALLRLAWRARRTGYDWLINLSEAAFRAMRALVKLIGAKQSVGFAHSDSRLFDHVVPLLPPESVHVVDRSLTTLAPLGITPTQDRRIELVLPPDALEFARQHWPQTGKQRVLVNMSGTGPTKQWGADRYAQWIHGVRNAHPALEFAITGHQRDQDLMSQVANEAQAALLPLTPRFADFAAYIHDADYLFTPETSALHIAAAWQRPCLGLYVQREGGDNWVPYRSPNVKLLSPTPAVGDIPVEAALRGFDQLLNPQPAA
jgi:ADP-heptose:LPS heptosyltransferase